MLAIAKQLIVSLAVNPWALLILVAIVGIGYLIYLLIKNNKITDAIASRIGDTDSAQIIKDIRIDQLQSNVERQEQSVTIERIEKRLDKVESDVDEIKCTDIKCPARKQ